MYLRNEVFVHLLRHGTARVLVREENALLRREHLRSLRHEVYSAEDDVLGVSLCRVDAELVAVAREVGYLDYLARLIAVREDSGVSLLLELDYLVL